MFDLAVLVDIIPVEKKYSHFLFLLENPISSRNGWNLLTVITGFQRKIQFSGSNILIKNLFWKESEKNWIEIYIQFLRSTQKKMRTPPLLLTTTELRKPLKLKWIIHQPDELKDFLSADSIKEFNHLKERRFVSMVMNLKKNQKIVF